MTENSQPNDELDWLAFRYVAGELPADEESLFETRLADDQAAREAVERAFELREAFRIVASESLAGSGAPRRVRRASARQCIWGAVAVTVAWASITLVWRLWSEGDPLRPHVVDSRTQADEESAAVALAWAEVHGWRSREHAAADAAATMQSTDWTALEAATEEHANVRGDVQVPAWLLTVAEAVSDERNEEFQ